MYFVTILYEEKTIDGRKLVVVELVYIIISSYLTVLER